MTTLSCIYLFFLKNYTFWYLLFILYTKLKDLRHHLFAWQQQIRIARTQSRDVALARIRALDAVEDSRPLTLDEVKERKAYRVKVAEVDLRIEMDWRQRSRQL